MAEAFARRAAASDEFEFSSAGTHAVGSGASSHTKRVMAEIGLDVSDHVATNIAPLAENPPDAVYTMTAGQLAYIDSVMPALADRAELLDPKGRDIPDPYGRSLEDYRIARDLIADAVASRAADWTA